MKQTTRRQTLALLGGTFLASCTQAPGVGLSGETDPFEGGIGGTGIVGVLIGFGSLLVNGLRVEVGAGTRYHTVFGRSSIDSLAPGLPLTIYAQRSQGRIVARDVGVDYALIGTVRQGPHGPIVNNVPVRLEQGARGQLSVGTRVAIGGIWTPRGVTASRVAVAPNVPDLIAGTVVAGPQRGFAIGSTQISYRGPAPIAGQYAVALGQMRDGQFEATEVQPGRFSYAPNLQALSVEGYLEPTAAAPGYRVAGLGHSFSKDLQLSGIGGRRAVYFGAYGGTFNAARAFVLPESFAARTTRLEAGAVLEAGLPEVTLSD